MRPVAVKTVDKACQVGDVSHLAHWLAKKARYHSIELPDGRILNGLQSLDQLRTRLSQFPVPNDLRGKRVLDIGASDGWFSFEMERRGATVIAVDCTKNERFLVHSQLLGSKVEYVVADLRELSPKSMGRFHIVLFLGVVHNLPDSLVALRKVQALTSEMALVDSYISDDRSMSDRFDDPLATSADCLLSLCSRAGFHAVLESIIGQKAHVTCFPTRRSCSSTAHRTATPLATQAVGVSLAC